MKSLAVVLGMLSISLVAITTAIDGVPKVASYAPPLARTSGGLRPGSVPERYRAFVLDAGSMCAAAPPSVIAAQIQQESGWLPNAVSPAGAEGISQFLPSTWPRWSHPGETPFQPAAAIAAQGRYDCAIARTMAQAQKLGQLSKSLDLTSLMLAGYNAGPYAVLAAGGIPENGQTPDYVRSTLNSAPDFAGVTATEAGQGSFAAREIAAAMKYVGTPYAWAGGDYLGPTRGQCVDGAAIDDCKKVGFDCSGLVMFAVYVASRGAIRLSHSADDQTRHGTPVPLAQLRPGDLIGFTDPGASVAHHVGIYLGRDQLLNAPESNETVRIDSLDTPYYRTQQWRAVRYG